MPTMADEGWIARGPGAGGCVHSFPSAGAFRTWERSRSDCWAWPTGAWQAVERLTAEAARRLRLPHQTRFTAGRSGSQAVSHSVAMPWPTPTHIATASMREPLRRNWCSPVTVIRAPDPAIG
jgi:hypothetical protein